MKTALVALLAGVLVACAGGAASPSGAAGIPTLAGTSWKAVSVAGRTTVSGSEPTLAFDATKVTGSGGCNQFGGEYTFADGKLTFGEMPMTLIGCEEPISTIEGEFLKVLQGGVTVSVDDGGQILLEGPGGQALLVPAG
jgi:heat shock protein HslJ